MYKKQDKMNKKLITFGNIEIEKHEFHSPKGQIFLNELGIDIIMISSKSFPVKKLLILSWLQR